MGLRSLARKTYTGLRDIGAYAIGVSHIPSSRCSERMVGFRTISGKSPSREKLSASPPLVELIHPTVVMLLASLHCDILLSPRSFPSESHRSK